ncbi:MAG TPA: ABC transporter substrate-binding protein, partial [Candidatus Limnocylindrales bacterium]|nr:ABC transporter substrate-binding protein [Candidatus Limnocylindrales bacterium]
MKRTRTFLALAASASFLFAACTGGGGATPSPSAPEASDAPTSQAPSSDAPASQPPGEAATVRLQLQWAPQAQFAGYFAAAAEGYYEAENLQVEILDGGPDVVPHLVGSAENGPEFTISWVPKVLEGRAGNPPSDLVNIAQIFQRSGTLSVSWKDSNITSPADFAGKKVGVWDFGNDHEVIAAARKAGLEPNEDYERVIQPFDMALLLGRQIDVAEAMIYNEYAQVLEATNPDTGELYQPEDLNVINYNDEGTAMLQDALFARASWLAQEGNEDIAVRFLRASFRGWIFCRDNADACIQYTVEQGSTLGAGHQAWMMNEVNPLLWPSPNGIGIMDPALWQQTVDVSFEAGIIP